MRKKITLPVNLTVFALAAMLLRAEVKAEIKLEQDHASRGKDARSRNAKVLECSQPRTLGIASARHFGHE